MDERKQMGGIARAAALSSDRRSEIARRAAAVRWGHTEKQSFLYVIGALDGPQKVGRSNDPLGRKSLFQTGNHTTLALSHRHPVATKLAPVAEAIAHAILSDHAVRGEWFDVSPDIASQAILVAIQRAENGERLPSPKSAGHTVQVRFAPPLHERFIAECERREVTPSEFIRKLVDAALNQIDTIPPIQDGDLLVAHTSHERFQKVAGASDGWVKTPTLNINTKKRGAAGVRGFALDGSALTTKATDRLKKEKK